MSALRFSGYLLLVCLSVALGCSGPEPRNAAPIGTNIIAFGDSLVVGVGAGDGGGWVDQLSAAIGRPIVNAGKSGDTTAKALGRLEPEVLAQDPRIVLVSLGGNDLKNGVEAEAAFANLEQVVSRIQDRGALVIVGGIDIPMFGKGYGEGYEDLCERMRCVLVPNILKGIFGNRQLMSDQIHPNQEGYAIVAERFEEAIRPYL